LPVDRAPWGARRTAVDRGADDGGVARCGAELDDEPDDDEPELDPLPELEPEPLEPREVAWPQAAAGTASAAEATKISGTRVNLVMAGPPEIQDGTSIEVYCCNSTATRPGP
jgi:hypothetical protein